MDNPDSTDVSGTPEGKKLKERLDSQYASGDHNENEKTSVTKERFKDKDGGRREFGSKGGRYDDRPKYSDRGNRYERSGVRREAGKDGIDRDRKSERGDRYLSNKTPSKPNSRPLNEERRGGRDDVEHKKRVEGPKTRESDAKRKEDEQTEEEKKLLEEEKKKRQEEERLKLEEEEKRKAEEEAERVKAEEEKSIVDYVEECRSRIYEKGQVRLQNTDAIDNWPDEAFFSKLDSNLKKNTAFVKKVKNLTESQKESVCKELLSLNLTKYIGEVASAIVEAKLKMTDVPCATHICSLLHQRYSEFSHSLLDMFNKNLLGKKDEKILNPSKYRVDLRFLGELIATGVFKSKEGLPILANQLSILVTIDREHNYLPIITSFSKHCGDEYMGVVPRKYRLLAEKFDVEIPVSQLLPRDRQKGCRKLLQDYFTSLVKHITKDHKALKQMEMHNRKIMQTKGEISTERRDMYEAAVLAFQKLQTSTWTLADFLDEDMPEFPQEELKDEESGMLDIYNPMKDAEFQYEGDKTLFEDEDTRSFYETLPDLRAFIPGILYRDSEQSNAKGDMKNADTGLEEEMETLAVDDIEKELETEQIEESMREAERQEEGTEEGVQEEERFVLPEADEEDSETGTLIKVQFESFISSLPTCVNRDLIDKASIEFCMNFNTKSNRKKLVKTLFSVHRTRYDLLPFYSRLVAILEPCMPELAVDLVQLLKSDFRWHVRKKDQINVETKLKIIRFIGELVKFKVCPKTEALQCLKMLLFDFRHHNIEMACALLESCGRFLYRSPDSHYRTKIYLEVMMRKKKATMLDSRYETMIENAFYYSNPPEVQAVSKKERPPMHEYIRKLLYKDLSKATTEKVLRQMRKIPWDDPEIAFYATKCLTAVWNIRYNSVHCAANLLAGIAPYHEHVAIQVVDGILEDIRLGMEVNHPRYNQRRVSCVKYLGELYNYRMLESSVIFKVLYSLITFGVSLDETNANPLDPPDHLFRLRLVCVTLDTCGQFFDEGLSRKRLDCFLIYFQRYYWFKKKILALSADPRPFPIDVENMVNETVELVRPKLVMVTSHEDACTACDELDKEYRAKLANVLTMIETEEEETEDLGEGLSTIVEGEDEDEEEDHLTLSGGGLEESGTQDSDASVSDDELGEGEGDGEDEGDSCSDEFSESEVDEDGHEEEVKVLKPKQETSKEDEDFMAALDQMMNENIKARTSEPLKVPQFDIIMPKQLKPKPRTPVGLLHGSSPPDKSVGEEENIVPGLHFTLVTRKGNKQHLTDLEIPMSAEFAAKFKEREQANKMEKEKMKQMVLNLNERQEEEEFQEAIATLSRAAPTNTNRERKFKYQHPKGAPDADLIFGNKKRLT